MILLEFLSDHGSLQLVGIAHRDVKIENLLLLEPRTDSIIKLCDFGLAADVNQVQGCTFVVDASI